MDAYRQADEMVEGLKGKRFRPKDTLEFNFHLSFNHFSLLQIVGRERRKNYTKEHKEAFKNGEEFESNGTKFYINSMHVMKEYTDIKRKFEDLIPDTKILVGDYDLRFSTITKKRVFKGKLDGQL